MQTDDRRVHEWLQDQANEKVLEELTKINDCIDRVLGSVELLNNKLDGQRNKFILWAVVAIAFVGRKF